MRVCLFTTEHLRVLGGGPLMAVCQVEWQRQDFTLQCSFVSQDLGEDLRFSGEHRPLLHE